MSNKNMKVEDFKLLKVIGTGTFGKVFLATHNGKAVALKSLKKTQLIELKQVDHVKQERDILKSLKHPFIVNLQDSFQNETHLYLVFEFVQGGEIFRLLRKERFFPNDVALFYITEIVLTLEFLHKKHIAYRDLKPENLLIANDGHVKITDFGFAKEIKDKTYTLCGTPEYLAPEIILSLGHNKGVDWWALGVLVFELLGGYPPFYDENPLEIYKKITVGVYVFPECIYPSARDLISKMIEPDMSKRLGCMANGAKDIKDHNWFKGVDWKVVESKQIPPPWVPEIEGKLDSSLFDDYPESGEEVYIPEDDEQELFKDF